MFIQHELYIIYYRNLVFQGHNFRGTCQRTLSTLQTIGMQIANLLSPAIVWGELHRTDASAALALHLAGTRNVDVRERFW